MSKPRLPVWIGGVVALVAAAGLGVGAVSMQARGTQSTSAYAGLGHGIDDVRLLDAAGAPVRWAQLGGKPRALFFGFTHCPVICPVTVYELDDAVQRIGGTARDIEIQFVTLDSARDTPQVLHDYFSGFSANVHPFGGEAAQIDRIARAYEVTYRRSPPEADGGYNIDHTATVFLINARGDVVDVIGYGSPREVIETRLRALVGEPAT